VAAGRGELELGARLLGATDAARDEIGAALDRAEQARSERFAAAVADGLSPPELARLRAEGRELGLGAAVENALALSMSEPDVD
jgi:hypothetical protein